MANRIKKSIPVKKAKRSYGWKKGPVHEKLNFYEPPHMAALPSSVDLEPLCPPVYNQGDLGSCTAHAASAWPNF